MGRWIKHGGYYPTWILRVWRNGKGYCEERWMDEHMKLKEGGVVFFQNDIVEQNRKKLDWWIKKHNNYATREAIELLNLRRRCSNGRMVPAKLFGTQEQRKRWLKERVYARMPLFVRPFFYFIYRYFLRLGFLDGREGLAWHVLQGFWYRSLVDAKIYEISKTCRDADEDIAGVVHRLYGIETGWSTDSRGRRPGEYI